MGADIIGTAVAMQCLVLGAEHHRLSSRIAEHDLRAVATDERRGTRENDKAPVVERDGCAGWHSRGVEHDEGLRDVGRTVDGIGARVWGRH
jgi:hypothetical protein